MLKKSLVAILCALTLLSASACSDHPAHENDSEMDSTEHTETATYTDTKSETQTEADTESDVQTEADTESAAQTAADTESAAQTAADTESAAQTEADTESEAQTEADTKPEEQTETDMISEDEALEIAMKYWASFDIEKNGHIVAQAVNNRAPESVYVFVLKHRVHIWDHVHYSTIDEVWIDRVTGEAMPPYDINKGLFYDYDTIISIYTVAVRKFTAESTNLYDALKEIGNRFKDEEEKEQFEDVVFSSYNLYPGKNSDQYSFYKDAVGYDKKDLNGDGIEELVLLNGDYSIVALFSTVNGQPILLDNFTERKKCWIDRDGLIHIGGSSSVDVSECTVYRIAEGGGCLEELFSFGIGGHAWIHDVAVANYYKVEDGQKTPITEAEYNSIVAQYHEYLENKTGTEVNKTLSGLQFMPLSGKLYKFSSYEDIIDSVRKMTYMYNYYKISEFTREETEWLYDLSTEENRKMYELLDDLVSDYYPPALGVSSPAQDAFAYAIKDINGDGTDELVFIEGDRYDAFAVFTQKDGKIVRFTDYSFDSPSGEESHGLNYWINTVGLDLKPLILPSEKFDLG